MQTNEAEQNWTGLIELINQLCYVGIKIYFHLDSHLYLWHYDNLISLQQSLKQNPFMVLCFITKILIHKKLLNEIIHCPLFPYDTLWRCWWNCCSFCCSISLRTWIPWSSLTASSSSSVSLKEKFKRIKCEIKKRRRHVQHEDDRVHRLSGNLFKYQCRGIRLLLTTVCY